MLPEYWGRHFGLFRWIEARINFVFVSTIDCNLCSTFRLLVVSPFCNFRPNLTSVHYLKCWNICKHQIRSRTRDLFNKIFMGML